MSGEDVPWSKADRLRVAGAVAPQLRGQTRRTACRRVGIVNADGVVVGYTSLADVQKALLERHRIEIDVVDGVTPSEIICEGCGVPLPYKPRRKMCVRCRDGLCVDCENKLGSRCGRKKGRLRCRTCDLLHRSRLSEATIAAAADHCCPGCGVKLSDLRASHCRTCENGRRVGDAHPHSLEKKRPGISAEILARFSRGETYMAIGRELGVCRRSVARIVNRERAGELLDEPARRANRRARRETP